MEIAIVIGAILVSFFVLMRVLKVMRSTLRIAVVVALILLFLQLVFGISPQTLWEQIQNWFTNLRL